MGRAIGPRGKRNGVALRGLTHITLAPLPAL
nr:MAG TPA: hypothetical protein [Caudoviricetes sp.]